MSRDILDRLKKGVLVGDGAMGTMLYARGIYINRCFDELNFTDPDLVREVHAAYMDAGCDFIETNTFGAARFKLDPHGLGRKVAEINRAGADIAREAAGDAFLVGGSIGPLGVPIEPIGRVGFEEARAAFREQAAALHEGGVDFFLLETFRRLEEIREALLAVREASDKPVFAMMSISGGEDSALGYSPERIARSLNEFAPDVIGLNCGVGPQPMLEAAEKMAPLTKRPICVMPNAGSPRLVEGRYMYLSSPEYFAEFAMRFVRAGVRVLGGCCGTTPEHIKEMRKAARSVLPSEFTRPARQPSATVEIRDPGVEPVPREKKSHLGEKIAAGQFVCSVEISPPKSPDPSKVLKRIALLKDAGVDAVNIPDGPRASARMGSAALAQLAARETGIDVILHYCCRDRNLLGMQSDLLGFGALGLKNILVITGDPPKMGEYPDATAVFDVDSIGLMQIANRLNHGQDLVGNPIDQPTSLHLGCGANPGAVNLDEEIRRFEYKVEAGAEYVMTQPVYDPAVLERFVKRTEHCRIPVLVGILPLRNLRNAEFLTNEVPGMEVPERIRKRLAEASSPEDARSVGADVARRTLIESLPFCQGVYVMTPFNSVKSALSVLDALPETHRAARPVE